MLQGQYAILGTIRVHPMTRRTQIIYWGNFVCESAAILAKQFPSPAAYDALSLLTRKPSQADNIRHTRAWLAGCALLACGGIIRLVCYHTLGKFFTWQLAVKKDHALITHGPYSIVRHPSYLGSLMLGIGTVLCQFGPGSWYHECIGWDNWGSKVWTAAWGGWSLILAGMLAARVPLEDEVLHREFGAEWEAYATRTRYKLIPYIY